MVRPRSVSLPAPYLRRVWLDEAKRPELPAYPFTLPLFADGTFDLSFDAPVTIIVGENGIGKSTLLEGIAVLAGFDEGGGGPGYRAIDHSRAVERGVDTLAQALRASWLPKIGQGWFFRAESFFGVARYLDETGSSYADFLSHSHGEGFLRFFQERCTRPGIFLFDEPEAALSPARQFDFVRLLRDIDVGKRSQAIVATHSPIVMATPGARLLRMRRHGLEPVALEDTDHFRIYREFVSDPRGIVEAMLDGGSSG